MVVTLSSSSLADAEEVRKIFDKIPKGVLKPRTPPNWSEGIPLLPDTRPANTGAYWALILPGVRATDPHGGAFRAMSEIIEDRVTAIVREKQGKTYDICTNVETNSDCGVFETRSSHVGKKGPVKAATVERAVEAVIEEIRRLADTGPSEAELNNFKNEEHGTHEEDDDSRSKRNEFFADQMCYRNVPLTPEETILRLRQITVDEVRHQAKRLESKLPHLRMLTVTPKAIGDQLLQAAKRSVKETRERGGDELVA
jgi:predicted Zn-dependent peptidase